METISIPLSDDDVQLPLPESEDPDEAGVHLLVDDGQLKVINRSRGGFVMRSTYSGEAVRSAKQALFVLRTQDEKPDWAKDVQRTLQETGIRVEDES